MCNLTMYVVQIARATSHDVWKLFSYLIHGMGLVWQFIETSEVTLKLGKGYSKYYATVDLGDTRVGRTRVLEGQPRDPVWNESFCIYCAHTVSQIKVSIKDAAIVGTTVVGRARVPAIDLLSGVTELLFILEHNKSSILRFQCAVHLCIFISWLGLFRFFAIITLVIRLTALAHCDLAPSFWQGR